MPALKPLVATRIVAPPAALDAVAQFADPLVLRIAPDESLVLGELDPDVVLSRDPHAIVAAETGLTSVFLAASEALAFLERACEWELPSQRPAFAQGAVAGLPLKLWFEADCVLFIVPAPFAADFEERLA